MMEMTLRKGHFKSDDVTLLSLRPQFVRVSAPWEPVAVVPQGWKATLCFARPPDALPGSLEWFRMGAENVERFHFPIIWMVRGKPLTKWGTAEPFMDGVGKPLSSGWNAATAPQERGPAGTSPSPHQRLHRRPGQM